MPYSEKDVLKGCLKGGLRRVIKKFSTYLRFMTHKYIIAANAKAKTKQPMEIRAAGNPLKLPSESSMGNGSMPLEPGNPPGKSG